MQPDSSKLLEITRSESSVGKKAKTTDRQPHNFQCKGDKLASTVAVCIPVGRAMCLLSFVPFVLVCCPGVLLVLEVDGAQKLAFVSAYVWPNVMETNFKSVFSCVQNGAVRNKKIMNTNITVTINTAQMLQGH